MEDHLSREEQVKHFNAVMSRILNIVSMSPLKLEELEIKILSCHCTMQDSGLEISEHEHPNYELTFMELGEMTSYCDDYSIYCTPDNNNILFIPPATLHHRIFGKSKKNINTSLVFTISGQNTDAKILCTELANSAADKGYQMQLSPELANLISEIRRQTNSNIPLTDIVAENLLKAFITIFFQQNFPELFDVSSKKKLIEQFDFESDRIEAIKRALVFLIKEKNTIKLLEQNFHMSARHLNRIFKEETGTTINQYQTEMRLTHARNLLRVSSVPISEIAHSLGFSSPARFSCFFQKHEKCSPSLFRKKQKNGNSWQ
jgi:AraC-like DNA-binding protein